MGGHRNWSTVKPTKKTVDIDSLFEKMDSEKVNCKFQEPHDSNSSLNGNSSDSDNQPDHDLLSKGHGDVLSSRDLENDLDTMMTSNGREMAESALEMLEIANTVEEAVEESSEMNKKTYVGEIATGDGTMIEVHGTSEEELNKFLAGEKINVGDRDENPDAVVRTELLSETPTRGQQQQPDLRDGEVWRKYYRRIQEAETQVGDKRGWGNFDAVFMLSALEGDGVIDLKVRAAEILFHTNENVSLLYSKVVLGSICLYVCLQFDKCFNLHDCVLPIYIFFPQKWLRTLNHSQCHLANNHIV